MQGDIGRFKDQLTRQLGFIERSYIAFDAGHEDEAVRIATTIRVLLYDTKHQVSLLRHLQARSVRLLTTVPTEPLHPNTLVFEGLLGLGSAGFGPKFGNSSTMLLLVADDWWHQIVLVEKKVPYSRKDIVLNAADKDGGAHVDKFLTPEYEALKQGLWFRLIPGEGPEANPLSNHQYLMIRQMGYELLNSEELRALCK